MYTREEASQLRSEFWTTFGRYLTPHLSADGIKVNWVNYKTGLKHVYFRMNADTKSASISIELTHSDDSIQELFFEQFKAIREILEGCIEEKWEWELHSVNEHGMALSRIYKELPNVSVFNRNDWPALISFFKPRIIALDQFWCDAKYVFDELK